MEPRFVILLDYSGGYLSIIKLTPEELEESEKFDDFEAFLHTLEDRYEFRLSNCNWMTCETLSIYKYENGKQVEP